MKSLTNKLFALTLIVAFASGCASVTDAGVQPEQLPAIEEVAPDTTPDNVVGSTRSQPIVNKPL